MWPVVYFLVFAAVVGLFIWLVAPRWYLRRFHSRVTDPKDKAELEDKYRATTGTFLVMLGGVVGGGLAYLDYLTRSEFGRVQAVESALPTAMGFLDSSKEPDQMAGVFMIKAISSVSAEIRESGFALLATRVRTSTPFDKNTNIPPCNSLPRVGFRNRVTQAIVNVLGAVNWEKEKGILASFKGADMAGTYFRNLDFSYAEFVNTCLNNTAFDDAKLDCVDFSGAILTGAPNFTGATLDKALLAGVTIDGAHFKPKSMKGAMLKGGDFTATQLSPEVFKGACWDGKTTFPKDFDTRKIDRCTVDIDSTYMRICRTEAGRIARDHCWPDVRDMPLRWVRKLMVRCVGHPDRQSARDEGNCHPWRHAGRDARSRVRDHGVRHQNNWDVLRWLLMEASAHLGCQFRRLLAGAASGGVRGSFA